MYTYSYLGIPSGGGKMVVDIHPSNELTPKHWRFDNLEELRATLEKYYTVLGL